MIRQAPLALLAELTYRCPLQCGYCSNPIDWRRYIPEITTDDWRRVFAEASAMGVLHAHLSGGEPLVRDDLPDLVSAAHAQGLYVNLITSAWGLTDARVESLARAGVDHVQVSLQHVDPVRADALAGARAHALKLAAARAVHAQGIALSINVVLQRSNIDHVGELMELAERLGATRIELANTQFHGSAMAHRAWLMPSREQLERGRAMALAARETLRGRMDVLWVLPDYYTDTPRPCMDGWGTRFITVIPDGTALPCPGAHGLPGMVHDNVRKRPLSDIWTAGADFERFRGTGWMKEPCASCELRTVDHGGCRCQAYALTGDPQATDPACIKAPDHALVTLARKSREKENPEVLYRLDTARRTR